MSANPMDVDHYEQVYNAVLKMLEAGESQESVDDAVSEAIREYEAT